MKCVVVLSLVVALAWAEEKPKTFTRELPADVLRDFPGSCFASTACRVNAVGKKWSLAPFCGEAECVQGEKGLIERVTDCGPLPLPNEKCKVSNPDTVNATFPECCPKFTCEEGITLEYPQIITQAQAAALPPLTEPPPTEAPAA